MSDQEESYTDTGYSTPVPELDDHRHQSASVPRMRSRRGTADTLYTAAQIPMGPDLTRVNNGLLQTNARDFEEAIIDEEVGGVSPAPGTHRRGTVTTLEARSVSPPNSLKAFADARRRERQMSVSEPNSVKAFADARRQDDCDLQRTMSGASRRSHRSLRSRRYTNDNDDKSFASSHKSAEEDVCFPLHDSTNKDTLQIDFDYLEEFIAEESRDSTPPKNQPQSHVFHDLRSQKPGPRPTIINSDGEIVQLPSGSSSSLNEKIENAEIDGGNFEEARQQPDTNRFEFFSSQAEETIHAAELGDLVLPGEEIRTLFTVPDREEDGAWWLNMNNPTDEEIRAICKAFGVHPLTIEDIGTQEAREKIELFPSYYFACFRSFHVVDEDGGQEYEPFNIYVVVFREGTLSFSFSPNPHAAHVRKRIAMLKDYVSLSSDWICYALM